MSEKSSTYQKISFFLLALSIFLIPLVISSYFENGSDLVKSAALRLFGGVFIVFSCIVIIKNFFDKSFEFQFDKTFDPYLTLLLLAAVISTIFSLSPAVSYHGQYLRQVGLVTFIFLFLVYLLTPRLFKSDESFKRIFLVMEIAGVLAAVEALLQVFKMDPFGIQPLHINRPVSTFGNSVFFAEFLVLIFPFSLLNLSGKKNIIIKTLIPLVLLFGVIISQTRSAYIALIVEGVVLLIAYILFFRKGVTKFKLSQLWLLIGSIAVILVLIIIIFPNNIFVQRFLTVFSAGNNPRLILWRDSFEMAKHYLLTGVGLGMFPAGLENYYSLELRMADTIRTFDHSHNNFIQVLCTMGVLGLIAYVLVIVQGIRTSVKAIKFFESSNKKIFYLAFLAMFLGYVTYGMTNFDDIAAMFYLFIFIALLKAACINDGIVKVSAAKLQKFALPFALIAAVFCIYNFYVTFNELKADRHYKTAMQLYAEGQLTSTINELNEAVKYNPICWQYRMTLAEVGYLYGSETAAMPRETKVKLLNQVIDEIGRTRKYSFLNSHADGILSLVYYELGRNAEANSIKNSLFAKDPLSIDYRVQLSRYDYKTGNTEELGKNHEVISKYRPGTMADFVGGAMYNTKIGNKEAAKMYAEKMLTIDPDSKFAKYLIQENSK